MTPALLHIDHTAPALHAAFCQFVQSVFRSADFRPWVAHGGWDADYDVWALTEDGRIVASVGRTRMSFVVDRKECAGWQLGAVATAPEQRGRGLARRLMDAVLADIDARGAAPVLLFANSSVLDFYPRFGFRRIAQQRQAATLDVAPHGAPAVTLDIGVAQDRARLALHCARARALDVAFGARAYYPTALWHLLHRPRKVLHLADVDAIAVVQREGDCLHLDDVFVPTALDLRALLPRLVDAPVRRVEFGFHPGVSWRGATAVEPDPEPLFVRGMPELRGGDLHFPDLAHT